MDMTGEQRIPAPQETVWRALNDADILRACIPGCQELVKLSQTEMTAIAVVKVGPISARFQGGVTLSDLDPPHGYRITGEGQGGVAGHAKGGAIVRLAADGDETILTYEVSAQIGGKLAQLGARMIDATAKSMSTAFFKKFAAEIAQRSGEASEAVTAPSDGARTTSLAPPPRTTTAAAGPVPALAARRTSRRAQWLWLFSGILLGAAGTLSLGWGLPTSSDARASIGILLVAAVAYLIGQQRSNGHSIVLDRETLNLLAKYSLGATPNSSNSDRDAQSG